MGANTKIEWARHTFNPWIGCAKVSPACDYCYAENMMANRYGRVIWGAGEDRIRTSAANWNEPRKWDRAAAAAGEIHTVFCLSLGDIWDNEVDPMWRRELFALIGATPNLLWLLLSKRIGNAIDMCDPEKGNYPLPPNAALGATIINQPEWDRDSGKLARAAAFLGPAFTFVSIEPMLGPIVMRGTLPGWVICGGESGPYARPMHPDWARSIRDQCGAAGVPFFFKQWGEWRPSSNEEWAGDDGSHRHMLVSLDGRRGDSVADLITAPKGTSMLRRVGKHCAGRLLDGVEHTEKPPC